MIASLEEPEECVDGIILLVRLERERRKVDVAAVLLLGGESGGAGARLRFLV